MRRAKRISQMKVKWNLSHKQLKEFVSIFNAVEAATILQLVQKDLKDEGYHAIRLHGCAGCEEYIWLKSESHICPNCNNMDGRYLFSVYFGFDTFLRSFFQSEFCLLVFLI